MEKIIKKLLPNFNEKIKTIYLFSKRKSFFQTNHFFLALNFPNPSHCILTVEEKRFILLGYNYYFWGLEEIEKIQEMENNNAQTSTFKKITDNIEDYKEAVKKSQKYLVLV